MAEEKLSLHIDTDWKKQAQEEKRKLVEQAQKPEPAKTAPASSAPPAASPADRPAAAGRTTAAGKRREIPQASFPTLVETMMTQALYAMMEVQSQGADVPAALDLAKHHIDSLVVLEEKTRGNLSDDEKRLLDTALYQTRMQFVQVASRYSM